MTRAVPLDISDNKQQNHHPYFDPSEISSDLKNQSIRGGMVTLGGQVVNQMIQIVITMMLARLLSPNEFGLLAMVTSIVGFVLLFKDLGLVQATVQRKDVTHAQVSTLFWINIGISFFLMLIVVLLAPVLVWYYQRPQLYWITIALSFGFVFGGIGVQHEALLRRNLRFRAIAAREVFSTAGGGVVGVLFAWNGAGVWSLVWMALAKNLIQSVTVWMACGWWPGLPERRTGTRSMLAFGRNLTGYSAMNYFARNLDHILIGRYWGAASLALYSKAYSLLMLPIRQINVPISNVAIPVLCRLQDQPDKYRSYYLKAIKLLCFLTFPLVVMMAVLSKEIILIILGHQWIDASGIFMVLAMAALWQPICNSTGWVFISLNQTGRMVKWGMISVPIVCLSFVVGLPWGIMGVAVSYTIFETVLSYFNLRYCFKESPIKMSDIGTVLFRPVVLSLCIALVMVVLRLMISELHPLWIALLCSAAGLMAAGLVLCLWRALREELVEISKMIFAAIRNKAGVTP